jgi:predicted nucleic acid-binding protein
MQGQAGIIASVITESELLVRPEREGKQEAIERIRDLLSEDGIYVAEVNRRIGRRAATIRAAALRAGAGFKLPDAIIIATAIETGCDVIVSRDGGWRRITEIPIVNLDDAIKAL